MAMSGAPMNMWQKGALGAMGGASLASLFGGQPEYQNPASAGMPYLDKIPGALSPYYQPYIDRGNRASGQLEGQYGNLIDNPGDVYNKLGAGYKESPGYQFKLHQALMAGDNAAAAGGMAGSNQHQQGQMQLANDISSQDFNNYLQNVMGLYGQGIQGQQGFANKGYDASENMGTNLGNNYLSQANLAAQGANQQNQYNQASSKAQNGMWGNLAGLASLAFL